MGKGVEGAQLSLEAHAGHVDRDPLTEAVVVVNRLKAIPGRGRQAVRSEEPAARVASLDLVQPHARSLAACVLLLRRPACSESESSPR